MSERELDAARVIDDAPLSLWQCGVIALCFALIMVDGFDTQSIAFVAPALRHAWEVSPNAFGLLFSAGLVGSMLGAMVLGVVGDRVGRRPLILSSTLLFSVMSLLCATAENVETLAVYRFLAGIGLGGLLPNSIALVAEFSPQRLRSTLVVSAFIGFPLGAVVGGMASAHIIPAYGWEVVFIAGGIIPIVLLLISLGLLPESLRYLTRRPGGRERILRVLEKIRPGLGGVDVDKLHVPQAPHARQPVRMLFEGGRGPWTLCLWLLTFSSLLLTYFLVHWIPLVLEGAGLDDRKAIMGVALLNLGGILGSLVISRVSDRRGPYPAMGLAMGLAILFIALIGTSVNAEAALVLGFVFLAGLTFVGAQLNISALAATHYPVEIRSAGTGWSIAAGRVGSIVGPLVGGVLIGFEVHTATLFYLAAVPAAVALASIIAMSRMAVRRSET